MCGSNLDKCKERRLISGDKSCHVLSAATKLLYDCVPGEMTISSSVVQGILSGTGNMAYICKRPCYTQLEKIQRLEKELDEVKKNMREKIMVAHREELRKRAMPAATSESEVDSEIALPLAKRRLIFSHHSTSTGASPTTVTVS